MPRTQKQPRPKVSVADAAAYATVKVGTLRRWIADGDLPAYRVGPRMLRIDLDDIDALIQPIRGAS
jgi:excisionase family DNA binding protein